MISMIMMIFLWSCVVDSKDVEEGKCNLWQGKCPPGWKSFVRPLNVRVCLKIFDKNATYLEAQEICRKQYNSRVHGIGSVQEHLWTKMKSKKVITSDDGLMWVAARRKAGCYDTPARSANIPGCKEKSEQFEWDDQLTTEPYLFTQWDETVGAPNGELSNGAPEDCVVMKVHDSEGFIDDKDCSIAQKGFLCGMTA